MKIPLIPASADPRDFTVGGYRYNRGLISDPDDNIIGCYLCQQDGSPLGFTPMALGGGWPEIDSDRKAR